MTATLEDPVRAPVRRAVRGAAGRGGALVGWILLALGLVSALGFSLVRWDEVLQDDTYISLIYSRNLARGEGLVYNPGHEAVEGYTNFGWTVLAAGAMRLGWDPIVFVQVAGLVCALGVVMVTFLLARRIGASAPFAGAAAFLMGIRPALALEAMGGLETCFFALLVGVALLFTLAERPRRSTRVGASVFLALAALTRPEGVFLFGLLELSHAWLAWRASGTTIAAWFRVGLERWLPFALIVGAHLAWRYATYDDFVPNTAHAKVSPSPRGWSRGFGYVFQAISFFGVVFFALPYLLKRQIVGRGAGVLLFVNSVYVFYVFFVGGDFKLTWRFFVVLFPIWCALAALSFEVVAARLSQRLAWLGFLLTLGVAQVVWEVEKRPDNEAWPAFHQQMVAAGKYLGEVLAPDDWIAITNAGCIPYFADVNTLDMMGLSDKHIARVPIKESAHDKSGHERGDGGYVLDREPEVILFIRAEFTTLPMDRVPNGRREVERVAVGTSELEIVADPRFQRDYELVSVELPDSQGFFNYFRRR